MPDEVDPDGPDGAGAPQVPGGRTPDGPDRDITAPHSAEQQETPPIGTPVTGSSSAGDGSSSADYGSSNAGDGSFSESAGTARESTAPKGTTSAAEAATGASKKPSSANRGLLVGVVAAAVVLAGAGIALALVSQNSKSAEAGTVPAQAAPANATCPLTGEPISKAVPARPALAVKVDNYPAARPQSGLDKADIVFEEPVEGGITRLVAVFQCQSPALIGPIRSARAVDVGILDQLSKPIFIHAGGINPVLAMLQNGNLSDYNLFAHQAIVIMPSGRYAPYDTYVSASAAWGLDPSNTTPPAPLFSFSATPPAGTPVTSVHIPFSSTNNTKWTWNAPSGHWLLSYAGTPATTANDGQISTANVVVMTVHVTYGPWLENDVGGLEVQSRLTGSGPLMVLRNGVAINGTWQRASFSDPTSLVDAAGQPIALQPGQTWVEIVPSTVNVTTTSPTPSPSTTAH